MPGREITFVEAVREALAEALEADPRTFLMGEEIGVYGGVFRATDGLRERFGDARVRDTPIAESGFVGAGVGAAIVGRRPIVEVMFMDFIACAMDPIVNHAAKLRLMTGGQLRVPLIIRTQGGTGTRHGAQHSQMLESWFTHVPGLFVAMPSTPEDVKGLMKTATRMEDPVIFIEHRQLYKTKGLVTDPCDPIPFGKAAVRRRGKDVTIVATSNMNLRTLEAAVKLAEIGIEAEVIDPRTLVPLDLATITDSVGRTNRLLVVHEEVERSGWGGELIAQVIAEAFDELDAPPLRLGTKNVPMPFGLDLEAVVVPQVVDIVNSASRLVRGQA
jgi:acetoin:2,6-dichlorophenolindophenol oxidoreductase subunit beta